MSQTLKQSSVHKCTCNRVRCPWHLKVPCPWHYNFSLRRFSLHRRCHTSVFGVLTFQTGITGSLTPLGLVSLSKDRFLLVPSSLVLNQRPPMLAGQSFPTLPLLCACDGGAHCCIACYCSACDGGAHCGVGLSAALAKSYVRWCYFAEIKRFLYDFAVGRRAADLLHADVDCVSATSHRPHIGHQFSVVAGV